MSASERRGLLWRNEVCPKAQLREARKVIQDGERAIRERDLQIKSLESIVEIYHKAAFHD